MHKPSDGAIDAQGLGRKVSRLPRLIKRSEFLAAASGRRVHSSRMSVQVFARGSSVTGEGGGAASAAQGRGVSGPRFGLTVTKKTANAVGRNRIRRRLRALLMQLQPYWPAADIDFVIVGRAELMNAPAETIAGDLKRAFSSPPGQDNPRRRQGGNQGGNNPPSHPRRGKGRGHTDTNQSARQPNQDHS